MSLILAIKNAGYLAYRLGEVEGIVPDLDFNDGIFIFLWNKVEINCKNDGTIVVMLRNYYKVTKSMNCDQFFALDLKDIDSWIQGIKEFIELK